MFVLAVYSRHSSRNNAKRLVLQSMPLLKWMRLCQGSARQPPDVGLGFASYILQPKRLWSGMYATSTSPGLDSMIASGATDIRY